MFHNAVIPVHDVANGVKSVLRDGDEWAHWVSENLHPPPALVSFLTCIHNPQQVMKLFSETTDPNTVSCGVSAEYTPLETITPYHGLATNASETITIHPDATWTEDSLTERTRRSPNLNRKTSLCRFCGGISRCTRREKAPLGITADSIWSASFAEIRQSCWQWSAESINWS